LGRGTDGYFQLNCPYLWDLKTHFEPLLIYVCLPYRSGKPRLRNALNYWTNFEGLCLLSTCRRYLRAKDGLFCANCYSERGSFAPCLGAWCPDCYNGSGLIEFPVAKLLDSDGVDLATDAEKTRFKGARAGDHLMTPFQCELCHFHNIYKREPRKYEIEDVEALDLIHQCCKDALWSRQTATVAHNLREEIRGRKSGRRFRFPGNTPIPSMGPYPLEDSFGMKAVMVVLERSLDPGKYADYVQWDTFRKARSAITNGSQAGVSGLEDTIGAYEKKRMWISKVPTHTFWFTRFAVGIHRRVGEIKKQDEAVTIDVLHACERILEVRWRITAREEEKLTVSRLGNWLVGGFCTGLRGEEQLRIELAGTRKSLRWMSKEDPYFMYVITGRTKGNQLSDAKFSVPCVAQTRGTGLQPGKWVTRHLGCLQKAEVTTGRLFQKRLDPPRLFEMADDGLTLLEQVQARTECIKDELDVWEKYGLERSLQRGVSAHAWNMGVDEDLIKAINRW
jgi:hypothetical protein